MLLAEEAANIGAFEWNIQENKNIWSKSLEKIYALEPSTFGGTYEEWARLVHPDDLAQAQQDVQKSLKTGNFTSKWRVVWPDQKHALPLRQGKSAF
ncbi:MAG: PAS domain-containing protein [Bacteroidia bacterium]|nr:PAS domain-containing protein [Bacteroidia bacterium]